MKGPMKLWLSKINFARFRRKMSRGIPVKKDVGFQRKRCRFHFNSREMSILADLALRGIAYGVKGE
jgi:hypothetical protein